MKTKLAILFSFLCLIGFSQKKEKRQFIPEPSLEYLFQNKHTIGTYIALPMEGKRRPHSYLIPNVGGTFFANKKSLYFNPGVALEIFHRPRQSKLPFGFYFRLGYSNYRSIGQKDNVISTDLGISKFYYHFFVGYNFNLDKREIQYISPFRIGIKLL